jgi:hypothetical protein
LSWCPKLDGLDFDSINVDESSWLERRFEESEVLKVVKGMNSEKVLGLDGFSIAFFQVCWEGIKQILWGRFMIFMLVVSLRKVSMPLSLPSIQRNLGLLILRTLTLSVLYVEFTRLSL